MVEPTHTDPDETTARETIESDSSETKGPASGQPHITSLTVPDVKQDAAQVAEFDDELQEPVIPTTRRRDERIVRTEITHYVRLVDDLAGAGEGSRTETSGTENSSNETGRATSLTARTTRPDNQPKPDDTSDVLLSTRTLRGSQHNNDSSGPPLQISSDEPGTDTGLTPGLIAGSLMAFSILLGIGWYAGSRSTDERVDALISELDSSERISESFDRETPMELSDDGGTIHSWASVGTPFVADAGVAAIQGSDPDEVGIATVAADAVNGTLGATVEFAAAGTGVIFRYVDVFNYWSLTAAPDFGTWNLVLIVNGETVRSEPIGLVSTEPGTRLSVKLDGPLISIFVNGAPVMSTTDPTFELAAAAGLIANAGTDGAFSEFYIVYDAAESSVLATTAPDDVIAENE